MGKLKRKNSKRIYQFKDMNTKYMKYMRSSIAATLLAATVYAGNTDYTENGANWTDELCVNGKE